MICKTILNFCVVVQSFRLLECYFIRGFTYSRENVYLRAT